MIRRLAARLRPFRHGRGDDGYIMVIAVMVMAFALAITAVALSQAQRSQRLDAKDIRVQRAEQAADTGLQRTIYALNSQNLTALPLYGTGGLQPLTNALSCLGLSVKVQVREAVFAGLSPTGTCSLGTPPGPTPSQEFREVGNRSKVSVIVDPVDSGSTTGPYNLGFRIVAQGVDDNNTATTADDVARRRAVTLAPIRPFGAVEGVNDVTLTGSGLLSLLGVQLATRAVNGDIMANDDITVSGLAMAGLNLLNPDNSVLRTAKLQYGDDCCGSVLIPLANREQQTPPFLVRKPPYVEPTKPACPSTCPAQIVNKVLTLTGSSSLTLEAGDYHLCGVNVASGATLRTAGYTAGGVDATRIYVDSPTSAYCSGTSGTGNLTINGSLNPGVGLSPSKTQLYVTGNGTNNGTSATVGNSGLALTSAFFLYAPTSTVLVNYYVFTGSVIGYDTTMRSVNVLGSLSSVLTQDLGLSVLPLSNQLGVFQDQRYVSCGGSDVDVANPTKGC